jgi:putative membrane protein
MTVARTVWYPIYNGRTAPWGLSPLQDQQLGGLIMWIPSGIVLVIAGLALSRPSWLS